MPKQGIKQGFSLLELLITVAIISILAATAYPSYTDFIIRSHRTEGQRELLRYANLQEQVFIDNRRYAAGMMGLGEATNTIDTISKRYRLSISDYSITTFTLQAEATNSQTEDFACLILTINELGQKNLHESPDCW